MSDRALDWGRLALENAIGKCLDAWGVLADIAEHANTEQLKTDAREAMSAIDKTVRPIKILARGR
jgi:hypothetical protein